MGSSYITPGLRALDTPARGRGVAIVNEVGLDPGIDHLMAHRLMADYRASRVFDPANTLSFRSLCGGLPRQPNAFRYKFSWSPVGVLRALRSPSRSIRDFTELTMARPWEAVTRYAAPAPIPETFEVYPNRDSLPYLAEYGFEPGWPVKEFVRGTLRLNGWADAWAPVFEELAEIGDDEARLQALADRLWEGNAFAPGEPDRVVLCVSSRRNARGAPSGTGPGRSTPGATRAAPRWRGSSPAPSRWPSKRWRPARSRRASTARRPTRASWNAGSPPSTRSRSAWNWWTRCPEANPPRA